MVKDDRHRTRALVTAAGHGDRHPDAPRPVRPHRSGAGGGPPLRRRLPPPEARQKRLSLPAGRHPRRGRGPEKAAFAAVRHGEGRPYGRPAPAGGGAAPARRSGRLRPFPTRRTPHEILRHPRPRLLPGIHTVPPCCAGASPASGSTCPTRRWRPGRTGSPPSTTRSGRRACPPS